MDGGSAAAAAVYGDASKANRYVERGRRDGDRGRARSKHSSRPHRGSNHNKKRKLEITFDAASRREYLTGFRARKRERRAFGLAMQKKKDRAERLERRKENREARDHRMLEMEAQKKRLERANRDDDDDDESDSDDDSDDEEDDDEDDEGEDDGDGDEKGEDGVDGSTRVQRMDDTPFGDSVVVTTTYGLPERNEDEEAEEALLRTRDNGGAKVGVDAEQREKGSVAHFLEEVKRSGVLGSKRSAKQRSSGRQRKGKHGAADMKGMGGAKSLKMAKKTLSIVEGRNAKRARKGGGAGADGPFEGGKRGKGKGKRRR